MIFFLFYLDGLIQREAKAFSNRKFLIYGLNVKSFDKSKETVDFDTFKNGGLFD